MTDYQIGYYVGLAFKVTWDLIIVAAAIKYLRSK